MAVRNGCYQGNGMHVCPRAELDDGWLEITAIEPVGLLELALILRRIYWGALLVHPKGARVALELDGDLAGDLPVDFRVLPQALRVLR